MLSVSDLTDILGLSDSAVRRRIEALNGVIDPYIKRGKQNKLLIDSSGLNVLRRLEGLREEGKTIDEAVAEIEEETGEIGRDEATGNTEELTGKHRETSDREALLREQIDQLKDQVKYLRNQVEKKDNKLEEKEKQLQKLLTGKTATSNDQSSYADKSLWQVIREWLNSPAG